MADREARVRLGLQAGAYMGGLEQVRAKTEAAFRSMASVGSKIGRGMWDGGKAAAESMLTTTKHMVGIAATLGGAFSIERALTESVQLQSRFRDIAFNVNKIAGNSVTWQQVQQTIEGAAARTGRRTAEMATAFETVFSATGDLKLTQASLDAIGDAATATGADMGALANSAQLMARKFNVSADQMPDAIARIIEKTGTGGPQLEDMSRKFAMMAGEASDAGFKGGQGISELLGWLVKLDSRMGEEGPMAFKQFFQYLKDGSTQVKALEKAGHFKFAPNTDAFQKMRHLLTGNARVQAEATFTSSSRTLFDQFAKPFDEAVAKAKAAGKSTKEAQAEGFEAFDRAMKEAGAHADDFGKKLKAEAAQRKQNDPMAHVRKAEETLAQAFADPEMMTAVEALAKDLPELASAVAKFVKTFIEHPYLVGGGLAAGRLGLGALGGGIGAVPGMYRDAIAARNVAGLQAGLAALSGDKAAMKTAGDNFAKAAAGANAWNEAGKALGAAVALYVSYQVGKTMIQQQLDKDEKGNRDLHAARAEVQALTKFGGTDEQKFAAIKKLREAEKRTAGKTNLTTEAFGTAAAWITGDKSLDPEARKMANLKGAGSDLKALIDSMQKSGQAGDKVTRAFHDAAQGAKEFAKAARGAAKAGWLHAAELNTRSSSRWR